MIEDLGWGRYIPTLVGRLLYGPFARILIPVHPHACGEIRALDILISYSNGTSPRLWGDLNGTSSGTPIARYIPTLVGRFHQVRDLHLIGAVHPHACGEIV